MWVSAGWGVCYGPPCARGRDSGDRMGHPAPFRVPTPPRGSPIVPMRLFQRPFRHAGALRTLAVALFLMAAIPFASAQRRASTGVARTSLLEDPTFRREAREGLDALYAMRYADATRRFDALAARHPRHPVGPFLQALVPWWRILNDLENTGHDDDFHRRMATVVSLSNARLRRNPNDADAQFLKAGALAFRARLRANRGQYVRAARDGRAAMDYAFAVARRGARRPDFGFGRGVYDYYAAALREDYPRLRPVLALFPAGDSRRGIAALQRTFNSGTYLQTEAAYYLAQLNYVHEHDTDRALSYMNWLRRRYPTNAYFHVYETRVVASAGERTRAARQWREIVALHDARRAGYGPAAAEESLYRLARLAITIDDFDSALRLLRRLDAVTAGRSTQYRTLGRLRTGMALDALGRRDDALRRYRETLALPDAAGAHGRARIYLGRPYRG